MNLVSFPLGLLFLLVCVWLGSFVHASVEWQVSSPGNINQVTITFDNPKNLVGSSSAYPAGKERLYYKIVHKEVLLLPWSPLGVYGGPEGEANANFVDGLDFIQADPVKSFVDSYYVPHGKRRNETAQANILTLRFLNENKREIHVIFKVFDEGVAFAYHFPTADGTYIITGEETGFFMLKAVKAWMQEYDRPGPVSPAYENLFKEVKPGTPSYIDGWCFPALFEIPLSTTRSYFMLLAEAGVTRDYVGTRLDGNPSNKLYKVRFPSQHEAMGVGETYAKSQTPFTSSWHVIIIGDPKTIVESNLVNTVSPPLDSKFGGDLSWIVGGSSAWSWWSQAVGSQSLQKEYVDSASEYGWKYVLVDANWDQWHDYEEQVKDLIRYAKSKNPPVGIWLWYNSGGPHNEITESPRNRMHESSVRRKEFELISSWGVVGVKIDFWHADKQDRMQQYLDALSDAADYKLMVNFHGSTMPRGWSRQYPNLVSMESVRGAETYKGLAVNPSAVDNVVYAYTRNVVGPMDYTPLTFSAAYNLHRITYAHSLALSVIFECGVQHWADRADSNPNEGYRKLFGDFPFAKEFLRNLPTVWDDTQFLAGHPSTHVSLARRNGDDWWVASVSGSGKFPVTFVQELTFMGEDNVFEFQAIIEGPKADTLVETKGIYNVLLNGTFYSRVLPLSGFVAHFRYLKKLEPELAGLKRGSPLLGEGQDTTSGVAFKFLLMFLAVAAFVYFSKEERRKKIRRSLFAKKFF